MQQLPDWFYAIKAPKQRSSQIVVGAPDEAG